LSHNSPQAVSDGVLPPDVPLIFEGNTGSGSAIAHVFEIIGTGGVSTSVSGNVLTISESGTGITWNTVSSVSPANPIQILVSNGYICVGSSQVTFTLPLTGNPGDTFIIVSYSSTFQIAPNANQLMQVGAVTGLLGSTGTVTSNSLGDGIQFYYVGSNTWQSLPIQGTFTVVYS
jgi:hypothetical protein